MSSDTKNVKLGVCRIYFDNVDLGYTQGGVDVAVTTTTHQTMIDQFGKTPVNEFIEGRQVSVKCPLAETTLRTLLKIMPGSTLVTDGVQASGVLTFTGNPAAADTVTIGSTTFTFQTTNPTAVTQVKVGATEADSIVNLANAINLSGVAANLGGVIATAGATTLTITAKDPGTGPNSIATTEVGTVTTFAGATLTGGVAETRARVDVQIGIGIDMLAISKQLRLHPIAKADTDFSEDFIVHKTATPGALQFAYKLDAERIYNVDFMAYPDPVTQKLFSVGDLLAV